jgi:hypothetical protein
MNKNLILFFLTALMLGTGCSKDKTTEPEGNRPPAVPSSPSPTDGAARQATSLDLTWDCSDPDGDSLTYDIYFGFSPSPPLYRGNYTLDSIRVAGLFGDSTYYWRVIAKDNYSHETAGGIWSFSVQPYLEYVTDFLLPSDVYTCRSFDISGNYAFFSTRKSAGAGFIVYDISDPYQIAEVSQYHTEIWTSERIMIQGSYAYLTCPDGIQIIDISNILNPQFIGMCSPHGYSDRHFFEVSDNLLIAAYAAGLYVTDISNPATPSDIGHFGAGFLPALAVQADYVFVADSIGLKIVDISNPALPRLTGQYAMQNILVLAIDGNFIYSATDVELKIINVTDKAAPIFATSISLSEISDICFDGDYAYMSAATNGICILDVSNPAAPRIIAHGDLGGINIRFRSDYIYSNIFPNHEKVWRFNR